MFTATWNREIRKIADDYISNPVVVQIGSEEVTSNKNITQHIEICTNKDEKMAALTKIIEGLQEGSNCLVFCNSKKLCRDLNWEINQAGHSIVELHGDLQQYSRDEALRKFKEGEARVMVATDVASRGLDVRNIAAVVNWDTPRTAEDYVHRIGRTGRANDKGDAYTFMNSWGEQTQARFIKPLFETAGQAVPSNLEDLCEGRTPGSGGSDGDKW